MTIQLTAPPTGVAKVSDNVRHALTVDVEDWPQSTLDHSLPITERAVVNTQRMLELFSECGVKGTFFILGLLAEKFPNVVRQISAEGHEIASHGYSHKPVFEIGRQEFTAELDRSRKLLEDLCGVEVCGYRAPDFSITSDSLWALDLLAENGMTYDSSIVPVRMRRYGIDGFPRQIHRLKNGLVEAPLSTTTILGRRTPVAGGGYLRLYPYRMTSRAVQQNQAAGIPTIVYLHPYELDPAEVNELPQSVPLKTRITQGLNRHRVAPRLRRLFAEFHFAPLSSLLTDVAATGSTACSA